MQYNYCLCDILRFYSNMNDWKAILRDLNSVYTQTEIFKKTGISQPFISQLMNGKRKKLDYDMGEKLKNLHQQTQKQQTPSGN